VRVWAATDVFLEDRWILAVCDGVNQQDSKPKPFMTSRTMPPLPIPRVLQATLTLAALLVFSQTARADSPDGFIRIQCLSTLNRLEVGTFMTWNVCGAGCPQVRTLAKQGIYEIRAFIQRHSKQSFECDLGSGQKAVMSILDHWPGASLPGMDIDVSVNGRQVVPPQRVNEDTELNLQIQLFPEHTDAWTQFFKPTSVSTNLCFLDGRDTLTLPRSMRCESKSVDLGPGGTGDRAESAHYERVKP
jgi:hypothetical protein